MKRAIVIFSFMLLLTPLFYTQKIYPQKKQLKYYRVDRVKTVKGEITAVKNEPCYDKKNFIVIYLKEKKSGNVYRIEVSPQWFFSMDLMTGSRIEVTGSYSQKGNMNLIMTRSITFQGEHFRFRDKSGFPLWRGKLKRGNRGRGGKGRHKPRGPH